MHRRSWNDPRTGRRWTVVHNPGVELARPRERTFRSRIVFESEDGDYSYRADAVFGTDLATLTDGDLEGLLDQAREAGDAGDGPWVDAVEGKR